MNQEELKMHIHYDPDTGLFTRIGFVDRWGNYRKVNNPLTKVSAGGYLILMLKGKAHKAHRVAFLYMEGQMPDKDMEVDHIDGDRGNNKFSNLRIVTSAGNTLNKCIASNSSTGVIGVCKYEDRYRARINVNGRRISLGLYDTIAEAAEVRKFYEKLYGYSENHGRPQKRR